MRIRVLGTAAGGGLPQWNCGCAGCRTARTKGARTQDGLAVTGAGSAWYLVNTSPDLRAQLLATPELAPAPGTRDTPVAGVLLTSAELDHTLGLLTLREAASIHVYATATVRAALPFGPMLECYTTVRWHTVVPDEPTTLDGGLEVVAFAAGGKRPRYADPDHGTEWTVAYRFTDLQTGQAFVYAPGLAEWTPAFTAGVAGAAVVLLDGTFATADEFAGASGHLSIEDSLPRIAENPGPRYLFTHLNNTNPYAFSRHGVAEDGDILEL